MGSPTTTKSGRAVQRVDVDGKEFIGPDKGGEE